MNYTLSETVATASCERQPQPVSVLHEPRGTTQAHGEDVHEVIQSLELSRKFEYLERFPGWCSTNAHGSEEAVTVISCDGLTRFSDGRRDCFARRDTR